ncbi:hypothetical protein Scep_001761 [Stephania cephalantha]|uniref:Uncharacterized protein n=1 Tax=Stephania cephalantha TaxID=152367 RepID=A0AAP0Q425_9MAGN
MELNIGLWKECICIFRNICKERADIIVMKEYGVKESWCEFYTISQKTSRSTWWMPLAYKKKLNYDREINSCMLTSGSLLRALDRDADDEVTPNDVFLHVHTKDHDGMTFIDNRSARFYAELVKRREEHTQATSDQPIDEKQLYYDAIGECSKGRVYGLGSLAKRKMRYEDPGTSTFREPMVRRSELDAVVQRLAQFEAFVQSQLGMRMDFGASTFQAPPPPPLSPPPQEHHQQVGMNPTCSPQQKHDDGDEDIHDWLDEEHLGDES